MFKFLGDSKYQKASKLLHQLKIYGIFGELGFILPSGGVPSGRVCACSLRSRLVFFTYQYVQNFAVTKIRWQKRPYSH